MTPLDRAEIFRRVSGCSFLRDSYGISSRWRGGLVGQPWVKGQKGHMFDPTVASRSNFYTSFGCSFPRGSYGISTRWRGGLVSQSWVTWKKGHNLWSDRRIALKFLHVFSDAVFLEVATKSLLGDEEHCSAKLEWREKRVITVVLTVASGSNVYTIFRRLFSLG
jgi:hypothetical protein